MAISDLTTTEVIDLIFRDPKVKYGLTDFADLDRPLDEILDIRSGTAVRDGVRENRYFVRCMKRDRDIQIWSPSKSNPEEIVRQLWLYLLTHGYGYPLDDIEVEHRVTFGTTVARKPADIIVFEPGTRTAKIIIEVKKPKRSDGLAQLKSYLNAEGSPVGCWSNGSDRILLYRPYPQAFDDTLTDLPRYQQTPEDVLHGRLTLEDLRTEFDFKGIIENLEELVLASAGVDEFHEIFKIIFAKLYDEFAASEQRRDGEVLFRKHRDENETYRAISGLFDEARREWPGTFDDSEEIKLTKQHLQVIAGPIERVRLLGANMRVMDDAFEYLMPNVAKKKNGQFFTPRYVIDMCVKMLQPGPREYVLDPACGSAGFLLHAMNYAWPADDSVERARRQSAYASKYLWGFDFDERSAKVARALMLIAGDGRTRVFRVNSLDPREWFTSLEGRRLIDALRDSRMTVKPMPRNRELEPAEAWEYLTHLQFDVVLTNPPFAGEIRDADLLARYKLASRALQKRSGKEERDVLFIERVLDSLKPGGRAAMILPQGKFNNLTLGFIRDYVAERAQVLAVVGLHANTFQPHTGTKTSVLFLRKFTEPEVAAREDARREAEASAPDYAAELRALATECEAGRLTDADLPTHVSALLAEYFGVEEASDEMDLPDGPPIPSEDAVGHDGAGDAGGHDPLETEHRVATEELEAARKELLVARESGTANRRRAETKLRRATKRYDKARFEDLRRSLSGRLRFVADEPQAIEGLVEKYVLDELATRFAYDVFLAVSRRGGKTTSGRYVYRTDEHGSLVFDEEGGLLVDQDCVRYLADDAPAIAEAYLEWEAHRGRRF